jgi:hypothetical protein
MFCTFKYVLTIAHASEAAKAYCEAAIYADNDDDVMC